MFAWNDIYAVNVEKIDEQHRQIFELINDLQRSMMLDYGEAILEGVYVRLIDYTKSHFATEEKLMLNHGYPEAKTHIQEHEHLIAKVKELDRQRSTGTEQLSVRTLTFLFDWLSHHIMITDKKFGAFLNKQGVH